MMSTKERLKELSAEPLMGKTGPLFLNAPSYPFNSTRWLLRLTMAPPPSWYARAEEFRQILADHGWERTSNGCAEDFTMLEWWRAPDDLETGKPHQDAYFLLRAAIEPDPGEDAHFVYHQIPRAGTGVSSHPGLTSAS